jgi:hypothetical protein
LGNASADFAVFDRIRMRRAALLLILSNDAAEHLQGLWDNNLQRPIRIDTTSPVFVALIADSRKKATALFDRFKGAFNGAQVQIAPVWLGTPTGSGWSANCWRK